ncbi:hypothetical protein, partial [Pedobacter sp.]|uniref:hypothetical protein n=1 Tax=Pedobacter sp. TaxID=1411316 RepID=UPI003D7FCFA3
MLKIKTQRYKLLYLRGNPFKSAVMINFSKFLFLFLVSFLISFICEGQVTNLPTSISGKVLDEN